MSPGSTAAQLRTLRKGSNDHLALDIDSGTDRSLLAQETDAKGCTSCFLFSECVHRLHCMTIANKLLKTILTLS